jgi:hypothetical protein
MSKLMKPLFINDMFNREGKRIRANYIKTIGEYPLWIADGKPDKDYAKNLEDQYYLMIETNDYLVPCGYTEYELKQQSGYSFLIKEFYGNKENRDKIFAEIYKGKTYNEYEPFVKEQNAKEESFISEHGKDEKIQVEFLKLNIDRCISKYIEARDNNGKYADFHGAAFLNELDKCVEISNKLKAIREQEEAIKRAERKEQKRKEQEEAEKEEQKAIKEAENILINGGTIKDNTLIVRIADKYNINIPIRTRGWILNTLSECTISESGSISYRYWKSKGATGSQKVYDVLLDIRSSIQSRMTA